MNPQDWGLFRSSVIAIDVRVHEFAHHNTLNFNPKALALHLVDPHHYQHSPSIHKYTQHGQTPLF